MSTIKHFTISKHLLIPVDEDEPHSPQTASESSEKSEQQSLPSNDLPSSPMLSSDGWRRITDMVLQQANLNSCDNYGHTPLTRALMAMDATMTQLLLDHGANSNLATSLTGETPLYLAAREGFLWGVKLLLKHRADPNLPTLDGETPLYGATVNGHVTCVEYLLDNGADTDVTTKTSGETPTYGAALHGQAVCLKILIEHEANTYKPNHKGMTPLMISAQKTMGGYIESLFYTDQGSVTGYEASCSQIATSCANGYEECVALLAKQQNGIFKDINPDQTPLVWAARSGNLPWLKIFSERGAAPNEETPNGDTALFWATASDHPACVDYLLKHGADVNKATLNGETPLFAATWTGNVILVDMMLKQKADPNAESTEVSNLSVSLRSQHSSAEPEHVKPRRRSRPVIRHGSKPKSESLLRTPKTPLYIAARLGHADCVKKLLEYEADPNLCVEPDAENPKYGVASRDTPLIGAIRGQQVDCVDILLANGAIPEASSTESERIRIPLKIALLKQNEAIIKLLLDRGPVSNLQFFEDIEFTKRLCKDCERSFILNLVARKDLPWRGARQHILERGLKDTKNENVALDYIYAGLEDLSSQSVDHQTVFLLMMDFTGYSAWITTFAFTAFHALAEKMDRRTTVSIIAMLVLTLYFVGREFLELRHSRQRYVRDIRNWIDLGAIALVTATGIHFLGGATIVHDGQGSNLSFQRTIMSAGALLTLSFVGFLKTTFLPFSNFVGGVMEILWDIFPFGIVSVIVLVAFSFMYYVKDYGEEGFETFKDSFYTIFTRFVGDFHDATEVLDLAFGIVSTMVLLNVLIAIVSTSWENAVNKSLILLCRHRLELFQQVEAIIKFMPVCCSSCCCFTLPTDYDEDYEKFLKNKIFSRILPSSVKEKLNSLEEEDATHWQQRHIVLYIIYVPIRAAATIAPWLLGAFTFGLLWPRHIREALFSIVPDDKELSTINKTTTRTLSGRTSACSGKNSWSRIMVDEETIENSQLMQQGNEIEKTVEEMKVLIDGLKSDVKHMNLNIVSNLIDTSKIVQMEKQTRKIGRICSTQDEMNEKMQQSNQETKEEMQKFNEEMKARQDRLESLIEQLLLDKQENANETQITPH